MSIATYRYAMVPIGDLQLADYNPRRISEHDMAALKRSIREFGFVEPVVVRKEDNQVIGGHQRLAAMRALLADGKEDVNAAKVPVVYVTGLSDGRTKALNVALNRIQGEWDYERLAALLAEIPDDIEITGFSDTELADILALTAQDVSPVGGDVDVDALLAQEQRRFAFDVETNEDAELVRAVLARFGMTGPGNASRAFVAAMRKAGE